MATISAHAPEVTSATWEMLTTPQGSEAPEEGEGKEESLLLARQLPFLSQPSGCLVSLTLPNLTLCHSRHSFKFQPHFKLETTRPCSPSPHTVTSTSKQPSQREAPSPGVSAPGWPGLGGSIWDRALSTGCSAPRTG